MIGFGLEIVLAGASALVGSGLTASYDSLRERFRFRREFKNNGKIDLTGDDWVAAWQTSVNCEECLNTERITIKQRGGFVKISNQAKSPENPIGGYKWEGKLEFFHGRELMGHYFALPDEQNTNKGTMFFTYNSTGKELLGRWVGASFDGPLMSGFCVISRSKQKSLNRLKQVLGKHPDKVPIVSQTI